MADNVQTASVGGIAPPDDDGAFHRRRVTFVAPLDDTVPEPSARPDQQEHHPVNQTLAPEAPSIPLAETTAPPVAREPRPVSAPSHRADVDLDDVVPTDAYEARPASVARHSVDTSAITLPVLAVSVPDDLPQPPERLTLDDEVLARLVEKRFDDTATIDLMAVVQAQLALREVEAARFASWEDEITRVGTDEAARALEATRLRFTGVIPIVAPGPTRPPRPVLEAGLAPAGVVDDASPSSLPAPVAVPVVVTSTGPQTALDASTAAEADDVLVDEAAAADQEALVASVGSARDEPAVAHAPVAPLLRRPVALGVAVAAAVVVLVAVVLAFVPGLVVVSAVFATVAVPLATGLAAVAALASVSSRPDDATRVARRGPIGLVAGVVLGAVVGFGLLLSDLGSFAWQGFLVRAVGLTGLSTPLSVVVALLAAAVVAFIVAVMITGFRSTARD